MQPKRIFTINQGKLKKLRASFILTLVCFLFQCTDAVAQCPPTISLSSASASITIDDFADITSGVLRSGITDISISSACDWDLFAAATLVQNFAYSAQGVALPLTAVEISAFNVCSTPDHDYGLGSPPPPPRISTTLDAAFVGGSNYIVGTVANGEGAIGKAPAPCLATVINGAGTAAANPTTHTFRIDIRITPGIAPVITPGMYTLTIDFSAVDDIAPNPFNLTSFALQIEILPILQMNMTTSDQVDFVFSDIADYSAGITRYGATVINVSSSLDWDLIAVGTSTLNESTGGASPFWDQNLSYSATGSASIPIGVLELHQTPDNPTGSGAGVDYSPGLTTPPSGNNYIEVGSQLGAAIVFSSAGVLSIAGDWGAVGGASSVPPGSYLPVPGGGAVDEYRYTISYRITPGLPVTFNGLMLDAQPGYYTMQVRYLLSEDQ